MANLNPNLNEKEFYSRIEDNSNYPVYSKDDGTFIFNDGSLIHCDGLASPITKLAYSEIEVQDEDLL
jgi:hypothetical protein